MRGALQHFAQFLECSPERREIVPGKGGIGTLEPFPGCVEPPGVR